MRIQLDLKRHCIETEIKRRHEAAMSRFFRKVEEKKQTEGELMLLEDALKAFVFPELRNRWPFLAGGEEIEVLSHTGRERYPLPGGWQLLYPAAI
jgi:hypothetical protein